MNEQIASVAKLLSPDPTAPMADRSLASPLSSSRGRLSTQPQHASSLPASTILPTKRSPAQAPGTDPTRRHRAWTHTALPCWSAMERHSFRVSKRVLSSPIIANALETFDTVDMTKSEFLLLNPSLASSLASSRVTSVGASPCLTSQTSPRSAGEGPPDWWGSNRRMLSRLRISNNSSQHSSQHSSRHGSG